MAWIFNTQAAPRTNPWSWEWGSPESFAGHRPCGCPRCQVCQCFNKGKKKALSNSAPPAARARSADATRSADAEFSTTGCTSPICRAQIEDTKDGDEALLQYYATHKTFAGATVYIKSNVKSEGVYQYFDPGSGSDPTILDEKFILSPAHGYGAFVTRIYCPKYDAYDEPCRSPSCSCNDPYYVPPDVDGTMPPFTFFTSAKYPRATMCSTGNGDAMMWQHHTDHKTFSGLQVYIEPNASYGECFRAAGASAHDVDAEDTRIPFTFMSLKEFPRAVITGGNTQDWRLKRHFRDKQTFAGALIWIEPGLDVRDDQAREVIQAWIEHGQRVGVPYLNRDCNWQ